MYGATVLPELNRLNMVDERYDVTCAWYEYVSFRVGININSVHGHGGPLVTVHTLLTAAWS